jgi:hypothetical protein
VELIFLSWELQQFAAPNPTAGKKNVQIKLSSLESSKAVWMM